VITSTINVVGAEPFIWDVDVLTSITHTFSGDLDITVTSPAGTSVTLTTDNAGSSDNVFNGTRWDDSANPLGNIPYLAAGGNNGLVSDTTYVNLVVQPALAPEEPLAAFFGENPNGLWTLTVSDDAGLDGGLLDSWSLQITSTPKAPLMLIYPTLNESTGLAIPDGTGSISSPISVAGVAGRVCDLAISLQLPHTASGQLQAALQSPSGKVVTLTSNNGGTFDNIFSNVTFSNAADPGNQAPFSSSTFAESSLATDAVYTNLVSKSVLTPEESLGLFNGEDPNGTWVLSIADVSVAELGNLQGWSLSLSTCRPLVDSDNDSFGDACDSCPADAAKAAPGVCGCGVPEVVTDVDTDGTVDCLDQCLNDSAKIVPGVCGCGIADSDLNSNGVLDCKFNDELRARIQSIKALVAGLKPAKSKAAKQALAARKAAVSSSITELVSYTTAGGIVISVQTGGNLASLRDAARRKVINARKLLTAKARRDATKALDSLQGVLL
jgi:subtilisin-like proprotein convertase family protein